MPIFLVYPLMVTVMVGMVNDPKYKPFARGQTTIFQGGRGQVNISLMGLYTGEHLIIAVGYRKQYRQIMTVPTSRIEFHEIVHQTRFKDNLGAKSSPKLVMDSF